MTRRRCQTCKGEKRVTGTPNAQKLYPNLVPVHPPEYEIVSTGPITQSLARALRSVNEGSVILCPTCKGSGYQISEGPNWRPAPKQYIKI